MYVLQQPWKDFEIDDVLRASLRQSDVKQPFDATLFAMVANRALQRLERIVEIQTGRTWCNVRDELQALKVVEYDRGGARIQQTTELRFTTSELLHKLGVPPPPKLHSVTPVPTNETDRVEDFDTTFASAHADSPSDA